MRRALATMLALALLAGCGGEDKRADTGAIERAIEATEDAGSYRVSFRLESDFGGQELSFEGEGVSSADQSRGRMEGTMRLGGGEEQRVEMISAGGVSYVRGDAFAAALPAGKTWLKVSDATPTTLTPSEFFAFLRETEDVEEIGREQVRGEPALHLRSPLDMKRLAEESASPLAKRFEQFPQLDELDATIDVWIAERDDRLTRLAMKITHPDVPGEMSVTGDVLEYGVPLTGAKVPPAAEVAETTG